MGRTAVEAAAAVQYANAGTIEFLLDKDGNYYFMEMNTRIQVEHGVTELVTGRDLVKEQIHVAAGEALSFSQKDVAFTRARARVPHQRRGPVDASCPRRARSATSSSPAGPGVRVDTFAHEGCEISPYYDSMIAKLMTHGRNRAEAIARMKRCLDVMVVEGIKTNIPLHRRILDDPDFVAGRLRHRLHGALPAAEKGERGVVRPGRPRGTAGGGASRLLPLLLVPVALLPNLAAALPLRDLLPAESCRAVFLPLRLLAARELGEGRLFVVEPLRLRGVVRAAGALSARPAARALAEPGLRLLAADAAPAARRARCFLAGP